MSEPKYAIRGEGEVEALAHALCERLLGDLEQAKRPVLQATKCALDNCNYVPSIGYLTPGSKKVRTELNVSSVKKMSRAIFVLEILLRNVNIGNMNTKREIYYMCKGMLKGDALLKPLDFEDQSESDSSIDFIGELLECYREELGCYANDRGGETYSRHLIVHETLADGSVARVDLSSLGTAAFVPRNKPQSLKLEMTDDIEFCIVVESAGTANTLVANGITQRHKCIIVGAQGVPSNAVRGWVRRIQEQLKVPTFFFGDLDAYTLQNIYRTLKAGSAASLIRNANFSAPEVKFLGVLPEDVKKYDLFSYDVKASNPAEERSLKKAKDALANDPFFRSRKNSKLAKVLQWLIDNRKRCEQQAYYAIDGNDPLVLERILVDKIRTGRFI